MLVFDEIKKIMSNYPFFSTKFVRRQANTIPDDAIFTKELTLLLKWKGSNFFVVKKC